MVVIFWKTNSATFTEGSQSYPAKETPSPASCTPEPSKVDRKPPVPPVFPTKNHQALYGYSKKAERESHAFTPLRKTFLPHVQGS